MTKWDLYPQGLCYRLCSETVWNLFAISAHNGCKRTESLHLPECFKPYLLFIVLFK